ncbi:MAG TPA: Trm112 family protein [Hyphomicrobiaceae bacterium]|nr:Trm112 family protein [Hyphomicrobiaceae bacterium]
MTHGDDRGERPDRERAAAGPQRPATDRRVLDILVCPMTREPLILDRARSELVSRVARLAYPIRDGVPIMIASEARPLEDDERPGYGPPSQLHRP